MKCPECYSNNIVKNGFSNKKQRYLCNDCGRETVNPIKDKAKATYEQKGNTATAIGNVKNLTHLLEKCKVDLTTWKVDRYVVNKWDVTNKEGITYENYQIKAWLQRILNNINVKEFKKELKKELKKFAVKIPKIKYKSSKEGNLLVLNLFDLHFGKLGWKEETGSNYDRKIARQRFFDAIFVLINRAKVYNIDKILFPIGNDFFNADIAYPFPQTTAGTYQQEDSRWQKVFREGRQMLVEAINYCSKIAPVDIIVIPGNHDFQKSFYLGDIIETLYANNPNVNVNNSPATRKYYQYYSNLIGFTHGGSRGETEKRLLQMMPLEVPILWSNTKFREWHLGDIHHKKAFKFKYEEDVCGLVIRYMRSLSGSDAWHAQKGFKGGIEGAEAYIYDKKYGPICNLTYNIVIK